MMITVGCLDILRSQPFHKIRLPIVTYHQTVRRVGHSFMGAKLR
jgi:hypothetical protein